MSMAAPAVAVFVGTPFVSSGDAAGASATGGDAQVASTVVIFGRSGRFASRSYDGAASLGSPVRATSGALVGVSK